MHPRSIARCLGAVLPLAASVAFAHAVLTKASLVEKQVTADTPTAVTLQFNSGIEIGFTKVLLVDAKGEERALEIAPGDGAGKVAVTLPPLHAGAYGLRYKVFAADGHMTESILRFRVAAPE
ncbi:MAG: copper resistance CopC family protein [Candidatus Binatia bacterium]